MTDALGNLVRFVLIPGQANDVVEVPALLDDVGLGALLADKAFDTHSIVRLVEDRGAVVVIPQRKNRIEKRLLDEHLYEARHLIENYFAKLKEFKRMAMRCDKTDRSFTAMLYLAAGIINSR
jgi:transposase